MCIFGSVFCECAYLCMCVYVCVYVRVCVFVCVCGKNQSTGNPDDNRARKFLRSHIHIYTLTRFIYSLYYMVLHHLVPTVSNKRGAEIVEIRCVYCVDQSTRDADDNRPCKFLCAAISAIFGMDHLVQSKVSRVADLVGFARSV